MFWKLAFKPVPIWQKLLSFFSKDIAKLREMRVVFKSRYYWSLVTSRCGYNWRAGSTQERVLITHLRYIHWDVFVRRLDAKSVDLNRYALNEIDLIKIEASNSLLKGFSYEGRKRREILSRSFCSTSTTVK